MKALHVIAFILIVVGGLNWGLVGFFNYDLVANLLGGGDMMAAVPRVVYSLVGLAAIWELVTHKGNCKACGSKSGGSAPASGM